jgi:hypothetical protein
LSGFIASPGEAIDEPDDMATGPQDGEVSGCFEPLKRKELSAMEAGELLGCSERQFRRYRRYEEEGLAGLLDRRLGKASLRRVPVDKLVWMLGEYSPHSLSSYSL